MVLSGGAALALGLSRVLPAEDLMIVANVGDDFEYLRLHIVVAPLVMKTMTNREALARVMLGTV